MTEVIAESALEGAMKQEVEEMAARIEVREISGENLTRKVSRSLPDMTFQTHIHLRRQKT